MKKSLYEFSQQKFNNDNNCFLCGKKLNNSNRSNEHVFPKWLLRKFNLWDARLYLLNNTSIPYRQLTIPCCKACNQGHLSDLEEIVKDRIDSYKYFKKLPEKKIFLWIQKIYYGILRKERSLSLDRKSETPESILSDETLEIYKMCHYFLQSLRFSTKFYGMKPWSIFLFKTKKYKNRKKNFDFMDNSSCLTVAIRVNNIGIIACLQDNGTQKRLFSSYFEKFSKEELNPIQFNELVAKIFYRESLRKFTPKYLISLNNKTLELCSISLNSPHKRYGDSNIYDYTRFLSEYTTKYTGIEYEELISPSGKVVTFLTNEKGEFIDKEVE